MTEKAVCTVVTKNYLAYARTLATSLAKHNPDIPLYVLLADKVDGYFDPSLEPFKFIYLEDLSDQQAIEKMCFYYTPFELCCALRGFLHEYMFYKTTTHRWLFLDSDIMVFGSLETIFKQLEKATILLNTHCNTPVPQKYAYPHEVNIASSGLYNGGFLGLNRTSEVEKFIDWFKTRLQYHSFNDLCKGMFVDQIWLNLVPLFFKNSQLCIEPGANLGHWNLFERNLSHGDSGDITVNGEPVLFIHFSGWSIDKPEIISKYTFMYEDRVPYPWKIFAEEYRRELLDNGYEEFIAYPYAFSHFENGELITLEHRKAYYQDLIRGEILSGSPFLNSSYFIKTPTPQHVSIITLPKKILNRIMGVFKVNH